MTLKAGVRLLGIKPELVVAMIVAESAYRSLGYEMTVTSVVEGKHSRGSIHYCGCAFDTRTNDLTPDAANLIQAAIRRQLGGDFDVILEADHLHCEYQPKEPY